MSLALQAMWAANAVDIQRTLHAVCKRVLRCDPDAGGAPVPKPLARRRAEALAALARIFLAARAPAGRRRGTEGQLEDAMRRLQEMMGGGAGAGGAGGSGDDLAGAFGGGGGGGSAAAGAGAGGAAGAARR